jgi:hypothetical protein
VLSLVDKVALEQGSLCDALFLAGEVALKEGFPQFYFCLANNHSFVASYSTINFSEMCNSPGQAVHYHTFAFVQALSWLQSKEFKLLKFIF